MIQFSISINVIVFKDVAAMLNLYELFLRFWPLKEPFSLADWDDRVVDCVDYECGAFMSSAKPITVNFIIPIA